MRLRYALSVFGLSLALFSSSASAAKDVYCVTGSANLQAKGGTAEPLKVYDTCSPGDVITFIIRSELDFIALAKLCDFDKTIHQAASGVACVLAPKKTVK